MLNAVLGFSGGLVALVLAFYLPLPLTASTAAGGILWWLFSGYRSVLDGRKMSGSNVKLNASRSGLLDGCSPRVYSSGDGEAVFSPKSNHRYNRSLFDSSTEFFGSEKASDRNSFYSPPHRNSIYSPRNQTSDRNSVFSPPGRLNESSGLFGSPMSPRASMRGSVSARNETPVDSPSVSIMSGSFGKQSKPYDSENRITSPVLPPGSYPWLMPHGGPSSREKLAIGSVPVKIKMSKPTSSFVVTAHEVANEEPLKADASKQIIQALKALSRKRVHTSESDESANDSTGANMPKRRPAEFYHNLYASHLGSSAESSLVNSLPEAPEVSLVENRAANGVENQAANHLNSSASHLSSATPQQQHLPNNAGLSNKRPRPANDSGNQTAKKRNNNEILCSLSSSLAILDPKLLQGSLKRKDREKDILSKRQKFKETSCAEVQTLPSPILKDDQTKDKEDKGTATDKVSDDSSLERSRNRPVVTEKKVTENMAAALLKSAMMKFASSGELLTPDTSVISNPGSSETPTSTESGSVTSVATEAPKSSGFTFGGTASTPTTSSDKTDSSQTGSLFSFGAKTVSTEAAVTTTTTVVQPANTTQASSQPPVISLAGFPKPPATNGLFKFGADAAKEDGSKSEQKPAETIPVSKPNFTFGAPKSGGFSFGATTSAATVPVASVAPSTVASSSGFTLGQNTQPTPAATSFGQTSQPASTAPTVFGQSSTPATGITFGQPQPASTTASTQAQAAPTITFGQTSKPSAGGFSLTSASPFGQTAPATTAGGFSLGPTTTTASTTSSNPGGFSFTPSTSFSMGSSPTSTSASTSSAPIFSFGSSGFGQKQENAGSLFGMPRPATTAPSSTASDPPKSIGGFNFTPSSTKPLFPSAVPQTPEQKKTEGFSGFGQSSGPSKTFNFGGTGATTEPPKVGAPFAFGASTSTSASNVTTVSSAPVFNSPAVTSSSLFGSTSSPAICFGSTAPKSTLSFGAPTTTAPSFGSSSSGFGATPSFGSAATTQAPTFGASPASQSVGFGASTSAFGSTAPTFGAPATTAAPAFGSSAAPTFGSATPAFGSSAPSFGSSSGFGSGSSAFGSSQPTFGAVASTSGSTTAFGSSPATTTTTPQFGSFGSSSFGSSAGAPAFGAASSSTPSAPAFGAPQTTSTPAFGAPQTTSATGAFSFGAPAAPASGGFNFAAPQPGAAPSNMFQFGASGSGAPQAGGQQPFAFGAGSAAPGGFQNTMFSIGSGSSAPRSRTTLRTRKK